MSYSLVRGDLEPDMEIDVATSAGPVDLSGALDVSMRWEKPDGTVVTVELVVIDAPTGRVKRVWASGDSDLPGVHRAQVVVTTSNDEPETFPNDGSFVIWWVYPQLGD